METCKPWETPKIQLIMSVFNARLTAIKQINIMEARDAQVQR